MSKRTITLLFTGGIVAVVAGAILAFAAVWIAYANGAFVMDGPDVVGIQPTPYAWAVLAFGVLAIVAMMAGFIAGLVSWIGALLNTAQLEDKTWFIILLVLGLMSFGMLATIAYIISGPDSSRRLTGQATLST
jgi:hypothetical protein